jgi:hypothetical protein
MIIAKNMVAIMAGLQLWIIQEFTRKLDKIVGGVLLKHYIVMDLKKNVSRNIL